MTVIGSAHAPCFSYGVSASSDSETCYTVNYERQGREAGVQVPLLPDPGASRALAQPFNHQSAPLDELRVSQVVLESVDQAVAPDAVIHVSRVPAAASGYAVVQAGIHAGHKFDAGVVAAESLRFELGPQCRVLVSFESVLVGDTLQPMHAAVVARVCRWRRARHAEACTSATSSVFRAPCAVSFPRFLAALDAVFVALIREACSAVVASEPSFRPLGSQVLLAFRLALGVMICARSAEACGTSRPPLFAAILAESRRDSSRLSWFVCHKASLPHVEARGFSLWRWSETASLLERGGVR